MIQLDEFPRKYCCFRIRKTRVLQIAHWLPSLTDCSETVECSKLTLSAQTSATFMDLLSRKGLKIPFSPVSKCVAEVFLILDLRVDDVWKQRLSVCHPDKRETRYSKISCSTFNLHALSVEKTFNKVFFENYTFFSNTQQKNGNKRTVFKIAVCSLRETRRRRIMRNNEFAQKFVNLEHSICLPFSVLFWIKTY